MAHRGAWGVFVDVPRARSTWTKKVLNDSFGNGSKDGGAHALPTVYRPKEFMFGWVRRPDLWLRSFMLYRVERDWVSVRNDHEGPWYVLNNLTQRFETDDFNEFARATSLELPGLVTWFFRTLLPPWVAARKCEEAQFYLKKWFNIKNFPGPVNVSGEEYKKPISKEAALSIANANAEIYAQYDYIPPR